VRQRFHCVAGLHGDDFYTQRPRGLNLLKRQAAERAMVSRALRSLSAIFCFAAKMKR
jgi:hypothetical protein